jgi:hypothetical protein
LSRTQNPFAHKIEAAVIDTMPWQSAPSLIIIGGMFTAAGILVNGVDWVAGKVRENAL